MLWVDLGEVARLSNFVNVLTWGRFDFAADIFILNYINPTFLSR